MKNRSTVLVLCHADRHTFFLSYGHSHFRIDINSFELILFLSAYNKDMICAQLFSRPL
jgi:hypothetical protein